MKLYLAGPDVFLPDAQAWASNARELCRRHGFEALTPLDHDEDEPAAICRANLDLIRKAQIVVANLNPFRGAEPDSGTTFELGFALALGKRLCGYLDSLEPLVKRIDRFEGRTEPRSEERGRPTDSAGRHIENFGLPLNLMIAESVQLVEGDLEACLRAIRPRDVANN